MSDSHRAEVREAVSIAIDYAVQGSREYAAKDLEDYYEKRTKWVQSQTDAIMALLDSERERWIGEVQSLKHTKQWDSEDGFCTNCEAFLEDDKYQCYCDIRNEALDAVSGVLDEL